VDEEGARSQSKHGNSQTDSLNASPQRSAYSLGEISNRMQQPALPSPKAQSTLLWGTFLESERPRARRYPFVASIELTELQAETQTREQTSDLSLFGCRVNTDKSLPVGTTVWLRIAHRDASFKALGRVTNVRPKVGMGIVFTKVEEKDQLVLEKWIAEIRENQKQG
jgi:hypothetical protein